MRTRQGKSVSKVEEESRVDYQRDVRHFMVPNREGGKPLTFRRRRSCEMFMSGDVMWLR